MRSFSLLFASRKSRSFGVICAKTESVLELKDDERLWEKFYEISLRTSDPKNIALPIEKNPIVVLKKN